MEKVASSTDIFLFGEPDDFFKRIDEIIEMQGVLRAPLLAFRENLASALRVGNIPYQLTIASIYKSRYDKLLISVRLRKITGAVGPVDEALDLECARREAKEIMRGEINDAVSAQERARQTIGILDEHLEDRDFLTSAHELLRQLLVMGWGAFETLITDLMRLLINERPNVAIELVNHRFYKDSFSARSLIEALGHQNFDLSSTMGDFFLGAVKLDSLEKIRMILATSLNDSILDQKLKDPKLWKISQQRHLIVHRRGIIDKRYLDNTSDSGIEGKHIEFSSDYIESFGTIKANRM